MPKRMGRPPGLTPNGPEIRRLRLELGLTAAQVAGMISYHRVSYLQAETSARRISDVTASRLAKVLGVRVQDIASEPEPKVPAA